MQKQEENKKKHRKEQKTYEKQRTRNHHYQEKQHYTCEGLNHNGNKRKSKDPFQEMGKPKKEIDEGSPLYDGLDGYTTYIWNKGKTTITYVSPVDETFCGLRKHIDIHSSDKNIKIFGIKVGMERKKAEKIEKKLGDYAPYYGCENEKVNYIYCSFNME